MKHKVIFFGVGLVSGVALTLLFTNRPHYSFHSAGGGQAMWRTDLRSGQAWFATFGGEWKPIKNETPVSK